MKLYATTYSGSRKKGMGDNTSLKIELTKGNKQEYLILYYDTFMHVYEIVNDEGAGRLVLDTSKGKSKRIS